MERQDCAGRLARASYTSVTAVIKKLRRPIVWAPELSGGERDDVAKPNAPSWDAARDQPWAITFPA
jgi:hypothetical protein